MGHKPIIIAASCWLLVSCASALTTFDPTTIGVGARALGMGRAYAAMGDQADTIFTNPAGLGEIDAFQFTSMSGQVLEDINYTMLGGVYPLGNRSALGIGYVSANITGIELYDNSGTFLSRADFGSSTILFSYGKKFGEKHSVGLSLKFFNQNSPQNTNGNGTGMNIDLGILQKGLGPFSIGVVGQNLVSANQINYASNESASEEQIIKIGTKVYLLGERFNAAKLAPVELSLAVDGFFPLQNLRPATTHVGLEFSPNKLLSLRAGLDQDSLPSGTQSNLTYGLSLNMAGIGFHYAYHGYTEWAANSNHYFSISIDELGWPYEGPKDTFLGCR